MQIEVIVDRRVYFLFRSSHKRKGINNRYTNANDLYVIIHHNIIWNFVEMLAE